MTPPARHPPRTDIALRAPRAGDLPTLLRWRSEPEHQRLLMWRSGADSLADVEAWIARRTGDPDGRFSIVASGDRPVGFAQLTKIDRFDGHAYLGLFIDAAERGRGAAGRGLELMEGEAHALGLRKILLEVLHDNERAVRFWVSANYRLVGTLQKHHRNGQTHHDVAILEKFLVPPSQ
jgi:RimJ/RimL family protein N-acetyltransferase